jgi:hypothetical protein
MSAIFLPLINAFGPRQTAGSGAKLLRHGGPDKSGAGSIRILNAGNAICAAAYSGTVRVATNVVLSHTMRLHVSIFVECDLNCLLWKEYTMPSLRGS